MKYVYLSVLLISALFAQEQPSILLQADFNKMIALYGKDNISITLPPVHTLDSLRQRPFVWKDGYRIQVYAGSNYDNALKEKQKLQNAVSDSVYIEKKDALYRVQFGDYTDRIVAETKVDSMRKYGWPESWIVSGRVKKFESNGRTQNQVVSGGSNHAAYDGIAYSVQLGAFAEKNAAQQSLLKLQKDFPHAYIKPIGRFYKILAGNFSEKTEASSLLEKARTLGYTEAWITSFRE